jgi:hypothetical protein
VTSQPAPQFSRPGPRRPLARLATLARAAVPARTVLARAATPAAAMAALAAGVALGWAASRPAAPLAGHGLARSGAGVATAGVGAAALAIGALAVLVAGANGYAKAYSP